uniref:Uncharacterized protein n=1 Tax=Arundo donax TaxID=35708 RepID=A0A0A9HFY4_ARUDO
MPAEEYTPFVRLMTPISSELDRWANWNKAEFELGYHKVNLISTG